MATIADLAQLADAVGAEDSNVSSPLTDVDDKNADHQDIDHMQLDSDNESARGDDNQAVNNDDGESDSALSDPGSDLNSDGGNDTEAETERLYDTPKNQRQRDVVVDQFNNGQVFEHTPSKLRRAAGEVDGLNSDDEGSVVSSTGVPDESPSKTSKRRSNTSDDANLDSQGRKRKRSPVTAEQSESDQPSRKRTGSVAGAGSDEDDELAMNDDERLAAQLAGGIESAVDDEDGSSHNRDTATDGEASERAPRSVKKGTRGESKRSSAINDGEETGTDVPDDGEDVATAEGEAEPEEEPEEDEAVIAARNQEEQERKEAAFRDWTQIEELFTLFRERLYKDRLQRIEDEEQSLGADAPTHKEFLNMKQCLDERLDQKMQEFNTEYHFRIKAQEKWAVAQRAQIWGQFFQAVREKREQALEALNKQWYDIQTARRNAHSVQDWGILFPKDPTQRVKNAIAYNSEVSTLSGMARYEGFPAGPEMKGASAAELKADMQAMERARKGRQKSVFLGRDEATSFNKLGPAGEQFLKDTPWANPNHSAHKVSQPATTQPPSAEPTASTARASTEAPKPDATIPTKLSESPELSRSIMNQTAHAMKGVAGVQSIGLTSKAAAA